MPERDRGLEPTSAVATRHAGSRPTARDLSLVGLPPPVAGPAVIAAYQRTAGNAAVARFVQRHEGPTILNPASASVGTGTTAANAADRKKNVESILDDSQEGKDAKKIAYDNSVTINWAGTAGGGSYFQGPKSVTFDTNQSDENTALAYVHEMNHARAYAAGVSAKVTLPRDDYLKATFTEETEGTVLAIIAGRHTDETAAAATKKGDTPKKLTASFAFQTEYWKAHDDAIAALPKDTAADEQEKKGREAGTKKIYSGFMDGTIKTSMPGNPSYVKWYGDIWDAANPPPKPA
jgi:hypothetical protein